MNIVVSANKKYIRPLKVLLYSIYSQNKGVHTYFINFSVKKEDILDLEKITSKFEGCKFTSINVPRNISNCFRGNYSINQGISNLNKANLSIETFSRVLSLLLLPKDLDRALYLDVDTIVKGDLSNFYNKDFKNHSAIGMNIYKDIKYETAYKDFLQNSFNAGVVLLNLKKIRENKAIDSREICKLINETLVSNNLCFDEYVLNTLFKDDVLFEDYLKYNLPTDLRYLNDDILNNKQKYIDEALILHYIHSIKPWNANHLLNKEFCKVWRSYAKQRSDAFKDIKVLKEVTHGNLRRK